MNWRSLIPQIREAEEKVLEAQRAQREASDQALMLQGQVIALQREIDSLREELRKANQEKEKAYQLMVNVEFQRKYGMVPYPDAPHLPERITKDAELGPIDPLFVNGHVLVRKRNRQARKAAERVLFGEELGDEDEEEDY